MFSYLSPLPATPSKRKERERERDRFMNIIIPSMATYKICLSCHPFVDFEWSEVSFNLLKLIYWPNFHPRSLKFFQILNQSQIIIYSNISSEFYSYLCFLLMFLSNNPFLVFKMPPTQKKLGISNFQILMGNDWSYFLQHIIWLFITLTICTFKISHIIY